MKRLLALALLCCGLSTQVLASDEIPPASERFAPETAEETPSFRRHVLPLMGRLGCNGRACHGSFQGRGGFRLSLFGYDFDNDLEAITKGDAPRVDLKTVSESLILQKPTLAIDHEGGKRMEAGSWQYRLLSNWVKGGAKGLADDEAEFDRLEITPREILFTKPGETAQLKVVAHWQDGTHEDVTQICRFRSNDEATTKISEAGLVTCVAMGDTHVVAFYDNGVSPVQTILPVSDKVGPKYPETPTPTKIDQFVVQKLRKLGTVASEVASDDEFLRRVSLDMTGTPPTPKEITAFLADQSPDKRANKIEELLGSPAYAAWWSTKLCDFTGNNESNAGENQFRREMTDQWFAWIERRVKENVPYDKLIEGIVLAKSRDEGQTYEDFAAEMASYYRKNDPADFTACETMPHYWAKRMATQPKDQALNFSYAFLGVRLQCAECHKHPFDQWTKQDFEQFTAFFNGVKYGNRNEDRPAIAKINEAINLGDKKGGEAQKLIADAAKRGEVVPVREVYLDQKVIKSPPKAAAKPTDKNKKQPAGRVITPKLLGGEEVVASEYPDPRKALMEWMRSQDNPYFAKAFVNRVWANYFNVGIIEPPDDMNLANPPSNEPLLAYLTEGFVSHDYDMKWLHREIANSRTYQLSWRTNETNQFDNRNFSHAVIRRIPAEAAYDSVLHATASSGVMERMHRDVSDRQIGKASGYIARANQQNNAPGAYAMTLFGKPQRASGCDCERQAEPSLLQTVYLRNDKEVLDMLDRGDGWLKEVERQLKGDFAKEDKPEQRKPTFDKDKMLDRIANMEGQLKKAKAADMEKEVESLTKKIADARRAVERLPKEPAPVQEAVAETPREPRSVSPQEMELVREAYLRTVNRLPNDRELATSQTHLAESVDTISGLRDLMWALLNTKEFIVNR